MKLHGYADTQSMLDMLAALGILGTLLVLGGLSLKSRQLLGALLALVPALIFWAAASDLVSSALVDGLERPWLGPEPVLDFTALDALVVLGAGSKDGRPSDTFMQRLVKALELARMPGAESLPVLLSGGRAPGSTETLSEAEAGGRILLSLGLEPSRLVLEDKSSTTRENAIYTAELFQGRRIVLITSALHAPRADWTFRQAGFEPVLVCHGSSLEPRARGVGSLIPRVSTLWATIRALHEYFGLFQYQRTWTTVEP